MMARRLLAALSVALASSLGPPVELSRPATYASDVFASQPCRSSPKKLPKKNRRQRWEERRAAHLSRRRLTYGQCAWRPAAA